MGSLASEKTAINNAQWAAVVYDDMGIEVGLAGGTISTGCTVYIFDQYYTERAKWERDRERERERERERKRHTDK